MKNFIIICLLIAVIAGGWLYFTKSEGDEMPAASAMQRQSAPVKVITQPVFISENNRVFEAVGTGQAQFSVQIYPAVTDEVTDVLFKAQQNVEKGDVLIRMDDEAERLAVDLAEVQLKDAKSLLDRYAKAVLEGAVPESEVDAARADSQAAEVALKQARLAVEERQVKAPFDGVVGIPNVDVGDRIGPDSLITTLDNREVLFLDFEVPEALAGVLNTADEAALQITAETPAYPGREFSGMISAQESRIDPERRTMLVRASIENNEDLLRPGMSFATNWVIPGQPYATVPEISAQWEREGSFVWLIKDGMAEKTPITVVARRGGNVLVEGDIADGDDVVVEGLQRLRPGQPVEVLSAGAE